MNDKNKKWIEAKKKFHLSDMHIQMARELGMNPKKFGKLANHKQEQWKAPLPDYIEHLYEKRFRKQSPSDARPLEVIDAEKKKRKAQNKLNKNLDKTKIK